MPKRIELIRRILWPERKTLFAAVGTGAGMIGDFANFVSDKITPQLMMAVFSLIAVVTALFCLGNAWKANAATDDDIKTVAECTYCDAFRLGLFSTAAFFVIMLLGQGQSVTEQIAGKLGLIEQQVATIATDVGEIKGNVGGMKSQVGDMHENTEAFRIVENPTTPAEHFQNAWVYTHMRRDAARGWESIQALYHDAGPRKLDGAELYFTLGRQFIKRGDLLAQMQQMGHTYKDGTLLVIAARNTDPTEASEALYAEAQTVDPDLPFVYWDPMKPRRGKAHGIEGFRQEKRHLELFLEKAGERPIAQYFFQPQYNDFENIARMHMQSQDEFIANMERMEQSAKDQMEKHNRTMSAMEQAATARSKAMAKEMAPKP